MYARPANALEAKFSLEYSLAVLLAGGGCTLDDFTDEAVARPAVRALMERVHRHPVDRAEGEFPTEVAVTLADGRRLETRVAMPAGSLARPFTLDQVEAKFEGCVAGRLGPEPAGALASALARFASLDRVDALMAPLGAAASASSGAPLKP